MCDRHVETSLATLVCSDVLRIFIEKQTQHPLCIEFSKPYFIALACGRGAVNLQVNDVGQSPSSTLYVPLRPSTNVSASTEITFAVRGPGVMLCTKEMVVGFPERDVNRSALATTTCILHLGIDNKLRGHTLRSFCLFRLWSLQSHSSTSTPASHVRQHAFPVRQSEQRELDRRWIAHPLRAWTHLPLDPHVRVYAQAALADYVRPSSHHPRSANPDPTQTARLPTHRQRDQRPSPSLYAILLHSPQHNPSTHPQQLTRTPKSARRSRNSSKTPATPQTTLPHPR